MKDHKCKVVEAPNKTDFEKMLERELNGMSKEGYHIENIQLLSQGDEISPHRYRYTALIIGSVEKQW